MTLHHISLILPLSQALQPYQGIRWASLILGVAE